MRTRGDAVAQQWPNEGKFKKVPYVLIYFRGLRSQSPHRLKPRTERTPLPERISISAT